MQLYVQQGRTETEQASILIKRIHASNEKLKDKKMSKINWYQEKVKKFVEENTQMALLMPFLSSLSYWTVNLNMIFFAPCGIEHESLVTESSCLSA